MTPESNILRHLQENKQRSFIFLEEDSNMESFEKPRKRRLDHLTWEEKIQRKKLKNRVAAQTSRDKKKAKMEHLEENFDKLMAHNERVLAECENLKKINETLRNENAELRQALRQSCPSCNLVHQNRLVECDGHLSGSAESELLLQQQGVASHLAAALTNKCSNIVVLKILLACLFCKTSLMNSTKTSILDAWMKSPKAFSQTSPATLTQWIKTLNNKAQLVNPVTLEKWWGKHQNNWNPMETALACKPPASSRGTRNKKKLKEIRPKDDVQTPPVVVERLPEPPEAATLCGYYDEGENCITIIVDDDQDINDTVAQLQGQIKESNPISCDSLLNPLLDCNFSSAASDGGYESLGSPNSFNEDLFDSTVSELFPQLI